MATREDDETPLIALARDVHPTIAVDARAFAEHARAALQKSDPQTFAANVADFYLCFACLRGDPRALDLLDKRLVHAALPVLGAMGLGRAERDEALQRTRERLLAPERGTPKLGSYAGRGPFDPWLRACIVRVALNQAGRRRAEVANEHAWLSWPSPDDDPELALLRRSCAQAFRRAAAEALEALAPADRLVLRQYYVDGLSAERLASLYKVHSATIYRRLERTRHALLLATRQRLGRVAPLQKRELDSLLGLLGSQLEVSIRRLLST
jgi:RNA polymerase sigma-70 factor, ECF subfamily